MSGQPENAFATLLFDGDCGFCQRWVNWAIRRGAEQTIDFQPCQGAILLRARANISEADCGHSAILVQCENDQVRSVHRAAAAINGVLQRLPGARNVFWRCLGSLYRLPLVKQAEEIGYRWVARNRHRFGSDSCKIQH